MEVSGQLHDAAALPPGRSPGIRFWGCIAVRAGRNSQSREEFRTFVGNGTAIPRIGRRQNFGLVFKPGGTVHEVTTGLE